MKFKSINQIKEIRKSCKVINNKNSPQNKSNILKRGKGTDGDWWKTTLDMLIDSSADLDKIEETHIKSDTDLADQPTTTPAE